MPEFEWEGREEMLRTIEHVPDLALEAAVPGMKDAVTFLHGALPDYPNLPDGSVMRPDGVSFLRTATQRGWFFAATRKGQVRGWEWVEEEIDGRVVGHPQRVGSTRTGTLGRKFTEDVVKETAAVLGTLGTNVPYAPWVVGPSYPGEEINGKQMYQARVHVDRWWQLYDVVAKHEGEAWDVFEETFWPELKRKFGEAVP